MNYAMGHAFSLSNLFDKFDTSKLKVSCKVCEEIIGSRHKEILAARVFASAVRLILDDIIHNGVRFVLPTRKRKSYLLIERVLGELFIKARLNGKWQEVDFLSSNFSANHMIFAYQSEGIIHKKTVYLDPEHRDLITLYTNNGRQYF